MSECFSFTTSVELLQKQDVCGVHNQVFNWDLSLNGGLILNILNVALIFKVHYFQNEILELFLLFLEQIFPQNNVFAYCCLQIKG